MASIPFSVSMLTTFVAVTQAQTFPGFEPAVSRPLTISWGATTLNYSQQVVTIATVSEPNLPTIGLPSLSDCNSTFLLLMVDPDAVSGNIETEDGLHTIQGNFTCDASSQRSIGNTTFYELQSSSKPLAPYFPPVPQPQSPPTTHRYTLLLFPQPSSYSVAKAFIPALPLNPANVTNRLGFNVQDFAQSVGQPPVAGNVFKVMSPNASSSSANQSVASQTPSQVSLSTGGSAATNSAAAAVSSAGAYRQMVMTSGTISMGLLGGLIAWLL